MIHDIHEPLPLPDQSIDLILDLMVSHCLTEEERPRYLAELVRVLAPRGVVLWKSFSKKEIITRHNCSKTWSER